MSESPGSLTPSSGAAQVAQVASTDETRRVQAPASPAGKPDRIARLAGKKGGTRARHVLLVPLDLGLPASPRLRTSDDRLAVIEALAGAIARGQVSALGASTLLQAVKEARLEARAGQEEKVAELEARLEDLIARGVIRT